MCVCPDILGFFIFLLKKWAATAEAPLISALLWPLLVCLLRLFIVASPFIWLFNRIRGNNPSEIDDIKNSRQRVNNGWVTQRDRLLASHRSTTIAYNLIKDEENIITRVERRGHLYALGFRVLTTLAIGLSVIGIYSLATYWDVNLPLMRPGL